MNTKMNSLPLSNADHYLGLESFCSVEDALEYAEKKLDRYGGHPFWMAIFKRRDFQKLILEDLSVRDAIQFARRIDGRCVWSSDVWKLVMGREDTKTFLLKTLSPIKAIIYAKNSYSHWVWSMVIEREDIKTYLTITIPLDKAISCAKKIREIDIWAIILTRTDLDPVNALNQGITAPYDDKLWGQTLFKRDDVRKYLLEMPLAELLVYVAKVNYWRVWGFIFEERKDLPFKEIICLFKKTEESRVGSKDYGVGSYIGGIIHFGKLSKEDATALAKEVNYRRVWEYLLIRSDISKSEALAMAQEENNPDVWKGVLRREDISRGEATSYAEKINDDEVWKVVLEKRER